MKWGLYHVPCVLYTDGSNSICFLTKQKPSGKIEEKESRKTKRNLKQEKEKEKKKKVKDREKNIEKEKKVVRERERERESKERKRNVRKEKMYIADDFFLFLTLSLNVNCFGLINFCFFYWHGIFKNWKHPHVTKKRPSSICHQNRKNI